MALTKIVTDVENISKLPDRPNQNNGLSSAQLKARFDLGVSDVKTYLNEVLTEEIDAALTDVITTEDLSLELEAKVDKVTGKELSTNDYDNTEKASVASNTLARHTHDNKNLLDTYTQTETNLADSIAKKHEHTNKSLLDSYTQTEANLADAVTKKHEHINKSVLDGILEVTQVLGNATDKVPSEKAVVDAIGEAGAGDMLKSVYDPDNDGKFSADIIVDGITNKVYTETEKSKMAGIDEGANNYIHPTTAGNKHIPSGGEIGQILKNTASGTVEWANDTPGIDIVNNLTETVTGKALDATQGKALAEQISNLSAEDVGALPISGGTLTDYLKFGDSTAYIGRVGNVFDFVKGGMSIRLDSSLSVANGVQVRNTGSGALYKIYSEANITISTVAPSSALAEGAQHQVYA